MWLRDSVRFNSRVNLMDLDSMSPTQIFAAWLDRIVEYYIDEAEQCDKRQNGFASMVLQLCAVDALSSFIEIDLSLTNKINRGRKKKAGETEVKIRTFLNSMLLHHEPKLSKELGTLNKSAYYSTIFEATAHLYFQYRCGLVHNGFTMQIGKHAQRNSKSRLFLMSYETQQALCINYVGAHQSAFIVNPDKFREMLMIEIDYIRGISESAQEKVGKMIKESAKVEIEIARAI